MQTGKIKKMIFLALLLYGGYFLLANHIIFIENKPHILPKAKLNLNHTFTSIASRKEIKYKMLVNIIRPADLRNAGLGELLVKTGMISDDELRAAEDQLDYGN